MPAPGRTKSILTDSHFLIPVVVFCFGLALLIAFALICLFPAVRNLASWFGSEFMSNERKLNGQWAQRRAQIPP